MVLQLDGYKTELKWGLILGLSVSLWIFIEFLAGFHTTRMQYGAYSRYVTSIIPVVCIWFGIKEKKKQLDKMKFLQGFASGMAMAFVAALLITGFLYVYNVWINPEWMQNGLAYAEGQLRIDGRNETQIALSLEELKALYTLEGQLFAAFLGTLLQGMIISAGFGYMLRERT